MTKFRAKPVVIEAFQITEETRHDRKDWPDWLLKAWKRKDVAPVPEILKCSSLSVKTLEASVECRIGDWIIRGIKGELHTCKPDIFEDTYEQVEE